MLSKIFIGSDHGAFEQRKKISDFLKEQGYQCSNFGPNELIAVDYPDIANEVCKNVLTNENSIGILMCGTGIGISIAANKIKKIRAACVVMVEMAALCKEHNNANVLCLSGRFVDLETNIKIIKTFLNAKFLEGRHKNRVDKICSLECEV